MSLRINDTAPDFTAETTKGKIAFHDWIGDGWAVLFSHPKNFTPVCTTELGTMAGIAPEFEKRGVKIIGISVDPVESHGKWKDDIRTATATTSTTRSSATGTLKSPSSTTCCRPKPATARRAGRRPTTRPCAPST